MIYTSQEAAKLLRSLNDQLRNEQTLEQQRRTFIAATTENIEDVRPDYDYEGTQRKMDELEGKIRAVKHAISVHNVTTVVPKFNITIDEMLVLIPQLNTRKAKLQKMANRLAKQRKREEGYGNRNNNIEYDYANYDIEQVAKDYEAVAERLALAQNALDLLNSTDQIEINI